MLSMFTIVCYIPKKLGGLTNFSHGVNTLRSVLKFHAVTDLQENIQRLFSSIEEDSKNFD